jgi:hypothetical protein
MGSAMSTVREVYVSTDVEADGPIPGPFSMLSLASAAFDAEGVLLGTFTVNLRTLEGATVHPGTARFWAANPEALAATRTSPRDPAEAMREYAAWLRTLGGKPVFVAYPAGFDFMFVYWYLLRFVGESPFGFSALDLKTMAMTMLGCDFRAATKRAMPDRWRSARPHTHVALDDALEQGEIFVRMLAELRARPNTIR